SRTARWRCRCCGSRSRPTSPRPKPRLGLRPCGHSPSAGSQGVFLGHFAVALAAKRVAPRTSLGTLTLAALWVDALWPLFLLLGVEQAAIAPHRQNAFLTLDFLSYPLSHSLLLTLVWGILFAI